MQGKFISLEGVDGSGKSTHIPFIRDFLKSHNRTVVISREPGGTPIGEEIRKILLSSSDTMTPEAQVLLFAASRVEHLNNVIIPALNRGTCVVSDRFFDSNYAYQGGGFDITNFVDRINHESGCLKRYPDLTFLFDLDISTAKDRMGDRNLDSFERQEDKFHQNVRNAYLKHAQSQSRIKVIDSSKSIAEIQQIIQRHLLELLNEYS